MTIDNRLESIYCGLWIKEKGIEMTVQEMIDQLIKLVNERPETKDYEILTRHLREDVYFTHGTIVIDKYREVQI